MEFQVNTNNVILSQINQVESGEYNVTECIFTFSSEFDGLTKKAVFTGEDGTTYLQTIVDNKCSIPSEILETSQVVQIGVYAYALENEELILRYSPEPTDFFIHEGSYKEAQNSTPPTPSEIEQLQAQITSNKNDIEEIQGDVVDINQDIVDIKAEQITQNENIQTNANNISTINEQISDINETITNLETNKANVTDLNALTERVSTNERDIDTIDGHISDINQNIDDLEQDLTNYSLITETGSQIELNINSSDFKLKAILKDKNGNTIHTSNIIDLPLETMVVSASYDNVTKEVVLTLQNGTTLRFSVADLVSGLVSTDELTQVLSNYYNKNEVDALIPDLTDYVKNTDYATYSKGGVVKLGNNFIVNENGFARADISTYNQYQNLINYSFIGKGTLENVITGKKLINQTQLEESQAIQDTEIEALQNKVEELETDNENLRKALPQIKGQGTDITLENTSENKFVEFGINGNTEQEQLSGKNLFDRDAKDRGWQLTKENYQNGIKLISTNNSGVCYILYEFPFNYNEIKDIYLNFQKTGNGFVNIYFKDIDNNDTKSLASQQNPFALTNIPANTTKVALYFYGSTANIGDVTIFDNIQLEIGSTATSYEPYCGGIPSPNPDFPQQIKNVTGNANVKIQNKNWFDEEKLSQEANYNTYDTTTGLWTCPDASSNTLYNRSILYNATGYKEKRTVRFLLKVQENKQYTLSLINLQQNINWNIGAYDEHGNNIGIFESAQSFRTFTTPANCKYIDIRRGNPNTSLVFSHIQLEEGSTATSYVEHKEQNYPFTFSEGQRGMQGTTLQDDGIHNARARVDLSTLTWTQYTTNKYQSSSLSNVIKKPSSSNIKANIFAEKYKVVTQNTAFTNGVIAIATNGAILCMDETGTPSGILEYELSEEAQKTEIIPYNATQQAQYNAIKEAISYYEKTNISGSSDELSPIITASAVGDLNLILDTMQSKLDLLEG